MRHASGWQRAAGVLTVLAAALIVSGCAARHAKPAIRVLEPWARAASSGANSGAYFTVRNDGGESDQLLGAECPAAMMVELHRTTVKDNVASMAPVGSIEAPGRGQAELKPGGFHVMLMNLKQDFKPGDTITMTLVFAKSGRIPVALEVRNP